MLSALWLLLSVDGYILFLIGLFGVLDILDIEPMIRALANAASVPFAATFIVYLVVAAFLRLRTGAWGVWTLAVFMGAVTWVICLVGEMLVQSTDPDTKRLGLIMLWVCGTNMVLLTITFVLGLLALVCGWRREDG